MKDYQDVNSNTDRKMSIKLGQNLLSVLLVLSPLSVMAAGNVSQLNDTGNTVTFVSDEAKTGLRPGCATAGTNNTWAISKSDSPELYDLIKRASSSSLKVEVKSGGDCVASSNVERASSIIINYTASELTTITDDVNFVARSQVSTELATGIDSVNFTLTLPNSTEITQATSSVDGYYQHNFGQLSAGNHSLKTTVQSGETVEEDLINFDVISAILDYDWLEKGGTVADEALTTFTGADSNFYGATKAQGGVSGGAASYSIPIALPPGREGIQPSVSLNYSSRSGLGVAGVGWSLSAGSGISRCPATVAQDGFIKGVNYDPSTDKLCLDGKRLIVKNSGTYGSEGTKYITEIDEFLTVTQLGGSINSNNTYFHVDYPNGHRAVYGQTSNSHVVHFGASAPYSWLISRKQNISDDHHMSYYYRNYSDAQVQNLGEGEVLLDHILYTGDGNADGDRKVSFEYEDTTSRTSYIAGGKSRQTKRLQKISTYVSNTKVRDYTLTYKDSTATARALLSNVVECGYSNGTHCRQPIQFEWSDNESVYKTELLATDTGEELVPFTIMPDIDKVLPRGDIDGNGSRDWPYHFINAEGESEGTNNFDYESCYYSQISRKFICNDADFNLDGRTDSWRITNDMMEIGYTTDQLTVNWSSPGVTNVDLSSSVSKSNELVNLGDYNGDGWPDIVVFESTNNINNGSWTGDVYLYLHSRNKTAPYSIPKQHMMDVNQDWSVQYVGDIDGDGLPDLATSMLESDKYNSIPTMRSVHLTRVDIRGQVSFEAHSIELNTPGRSYDNFSTLVDANGDGLDDWVGWVKDGRDELYLRLNQGNGTFGAAQAVGVVLPKRTVYLPLDNGEVETTFAPKFMDAIKTMDIDGDGTKELIMPSNDPDDMLVEACKTISQYIGGVWRETERCGSEIYEQYSTKAGGVSRPTTPPSSWDRSIYKYQAVRFSESSNGVYSAVLESTDLVAGADDSVVVDALGKGLSDLVFTYGCDVYKCRMKTATGAMAGKAEDKAYFNRNYGATTESSPGKADYRALDMLMSATNSASISHSWTYHPLSSEEPGNDFYIANHDELDDAHFHFGSSMYVVSEHQQTNSIGGQNAVLYKYRSAMYNTQGRGFRGFAGITQVDVANNTRTETDFLQFFPFSSLVQQQAQYEGNSSVPFNLSINDWQENPNYLGYGFNVYNRQADVVTCDLKATSCSTSDYLTYSSNTVNANAGDIDQYGNTVKLLSVVEDEFGTYRTMNEGDYSQATPNWPHKVIKKTNTTYAVVRKGDSPDEYQGTNEEQSVVTDIIWNDDYRKPRQVTVTGDGVSHITTTTFTPNGLADIITQSGEVNDTQQDRITKLGYTDDEYFVNSTDNNGHVSTATTEPSTGLPLTQTDPNSVSVTTQYDSFARPIQVDASNAPSQYIRYYTPDSNEIGGAVQMVVTKQAGKPDMTSYVNTLGQPTRTVAQDFMGNDIYQDVVYNARGLVTHESHPYKKGTSYSSTRYNDYDVLGRYENKITPQTNGELNTTYSYNGLTTTIDVAASVATNGHTNISMSRSYNALEQLIQTTDAKGGITKYAYNGQGMPITIEGADELSIHAKYDALGRKTWVRDPDSGLTEYEYSAFGELEKETDANGDVISYQLDVFGRTQTRTADGMTASFTWDTRKQGMLSTESLNGITKEYFYDGQARVEQTDLTINGTKYTTSWDFDGNYGRVKSMSYPNNLTIKYEYNAQGYLDKQSNAQSGYVYRAITEQDALGNITQSSFGNGIGLTNQYSLISGQMLSTQAGSLHHLSYGIDGYDSYGNLIEARHRAEGMDTTETYSYDELHRLTHNSVDIGNWNVYYDYDAIGNFKKKTDYSQNSASAYQYVTDSHKLKQVTLASGELETFGYDSKGNQIHRTRNDIQEVGTKYNSFNKPTSIDKGNSINLSFQYGADLMRYQQTKTVDGKTVTIHYIDKHFEVEISDTGSESKTYIDDIAIITEGDKNSLTYTLRDRLGSATTMLDHDGKVTAYRGFDPFGKPRNGDWSELNPAKLTNNLFDFSLVTTRGFTDHEHLDDVELIHMNGRVYDYNVGRFMSVDPFIVGLGNSQAINPYSYGMNNPLSGTDPTGYVWETGWDLFNVVYDIGKISVGYITGNTAMVTEGAIDLAADSIALATPFVPAGSTKLGRVTYNGIDLFNDVKKVGKENGASKSIKGKGSDIGSEKAKSKQRNKPPAPLKEAEGRAHSIVERPGSKGQYTTHNEDGTYKQYRGEGKPHGGIERPNVKETKLNKAPNGKKFLGKPTVRKPFEEEIPGTSSLGTQKTNNTRNHSSKPLIGNRRGNSSGQLTGVVRVSGRVESNRLRQLDKLDK